MRDFRRAVTRLLVLTAALLFIAWVSMRLMLYRGDWEALLRDFEDWIAPARRFFETRLLPMAKDFSDYVREKMLPWLQQTAEKMFG